jgi:hypothetical protein
MNLPRDKCFASSLMLISSGDGLLLASLFQLTANVKIDGLIALDCAFQQTFHLGSTCSFHCSNDMQNMGVLAQKL